MRAWSGIAAVLFVFCVAGAARAQTDQGFSLQNFQTLPGHNAFLTVEGAKLPRGFSLNVGGMVNYAFRPLMVRACDEVSGGRCKKWSDEDAALIAHQTTLELLGAVSHAGGDLPDR